MILAGKSGNRYVVYTLNPDGSKTDRTYFLSPPKARSKEELESRRSRTAVTKAAANWGRSRTYSKAASSLSECSSPIGAAYDP